MGIQGTLLTSHLRARQKARDFCLSCTWKRLHYIFPDTQALAALKSRPPGGFPSPSAPKQGTQVCFISFLTLSPCFPISSLPLLTPYSSEALNPGEHVSISQSPRSDAKAFLDPAIHSQATPSFPMETFNEKIIKMLTIEIR